MKPIRLRLSLHSDRFTALHAAVDKVRKGTKKVTVDRDDLMALLMDHSALAASAEQAGVRIEGE